MLTCLAQGHNMAHLLVSVDRRVMSAAVVTELSENPASVEHTSTKLGDTLPFTTQVGHAVKVILKAPMHLTLLRRTNTQRQSPAPSISFFCFIMQICYANWYSWTTLFTGLHFGCLCCKCCTAQPPPPASSVLGPKNLLLPASLPHSDGTCCPIHWFIDFLTRSLSFLSTETLAASIIGWVWFLYLNLGAFSWLFYSHQLCCWEVWWHLTLDHRLSFPCPALTPDSEGLLLPRLHLWPLLSFFFLLLTLRNFLQQHAPCKHLQAWPAHPSLVLTLFEPLKIISLTVSLLWLSENKEIKCIEQIISVIRITKPKPLNA